MVQLWGLRQSASQPVPVDDLLAAARYPFTPVRAAALERLSEVDPAVAATEWKRALLDSSPSIRAAARRRLLAETTSFDLRAFYRDALAGTEPTSVAPAVAGLAEVGRAEDAAELILLTEHPRAKVREAVAAALARLLGAEAIDADADRQKPPSRAKGGASSSASPDAAAGPKNLGYRSERGAGKSSRVAAPPSATSPMGSAGLLTTSDLPSRSAPHRGPDSGSTLARQVSQERCPARTWQSRCRATAEHARSCTC